MNCIVMASVSFLTEYGFAPTLTMNSFGLKCGTSGGVITGKTLTTIILDQWTKAMHSCAAHELPCNIMSKMGFSNMVSSLNVLN